MRVMFVLLALASAFALAADNAVIAPQSTASHKPQATTYGVESITIPQMLSYQGKLTDTLGQPVPTGNYQLTFRLYTQPAGGSAFWSEPQTIVVKSGLFSALLGAVTPIGSLPDAGALYLSLQVAADPELSPRLRIASAAYAYLTERAANADLLQGKDTTALDSRYVNEGQASSVTSNMIVDGTVAAVDLNQMGASSGQVMKWNGSAWVPRNDSVGQSSGGTVTSVTQATGAVCTPNPITTTGTVGFDQTYGDGRYVNEGQANSVGAGMIVDTNVTMAKLARAGATSGQAVVWNGSAWAPSAVTASNSDMVDGYHAGNASGQVAVSNGTVNTNLNADYLDGSHATAFAPASGSANYIQNQFASNQAASWRIVGQGRCSTATGAALYGTATGSNFGVEGIGTAYPGVEAQCTGIYGALEGINYYTSNSGWSAGVAGHGYGASGPYGVYGDAANIGVYGTSSANAGVYGNSSTNYGVSGNSSSSYGVYGKSTSNIGVLGSSATSTYAGVYGQSSVTGSGSGIGTYGYSPTYWGGQGYRGSSQQGSGYGQTGTRGGLWGFTYWGDTFAFGTAGYTFGDYARTGGVIGGRDDAATWGSLGYRNSSGTWYAGYGTAAWNTGSGLSSRPATGIGCGYGGGLMGGWLKGTYYGATVSGDRYALYTKGNNYTSGYSAVMHNTGGKREASYVPTSTTVDVYTSGEAEMKGGKATVSFPASFTAMVSKDVPVVVTATPMGPAPIYLSSRDSKGFAVEAVDAKASVKFSWIAVGRRAGYETNPEVPAELARTDFDDKMDGVMSDENDLKHPAQPVWFDGTQLRFDAPPPEPVRPKPAQQALIQQNQAPTEPVRAVPSGDFRQTTSVTRPATPSTAQTPSEARTPGAEK